MAGRLFRHIYGVYASTVVSVVIFGLFCPLIIITPLLAARRTLGRLCVRTALALACVPFRVRGREHLPRGTAVVVANHSSYLDGLVLTAALPVRYTFMVKQAAATWPYVGLVIKRMGVRFINRVSKREGAVQTLRLIRDLKSGMSLAVFAEGTFKKPIGLLPFQKGAFAIAAKAGVPVVPVAIRGTRGLWGANGWLLNWTPIEIQIMPPILPAGSSPQAVEQLRDTARAAVLAAVGEPDLAPQ